MSELTTKDMDEVNILLTEVALQMLGNEFFDIFGVQHNTLSELMETEKQTRPTDYDVRKCALLTKITIPDLYDETCDSMGEPAKNPTAAVKRSRRASSDCVSTFQKPHPVEPIPFHDPESLLVPMGSRPAKKGVAGRINRRRFTVCDNSAARQRNVFAKPSPRPVFAMPAAVSAKKATPTTSNSQITVPLHKSGINDKLNRTPTPFVLPTILNELKDDALPIITPTDAVLSSMEEKVGELRTKVKEESQRLLEESKKNCLNYFLTNRDLLGSTLYKSEFEIIDEFHRIEKDQLMYTCNQLIEFVKFLKMDEDFQEKMGPLANCILQLKESI